MSQVATYRDKRQVVAKPYAPGGCPIHVGKQKCGETQGLDIILDFHKMYEDKMNEIDLSAGGDSLQEKVDLQEQWISDLTEQNRLLARVIEELESETIGKVQQLEDKLNNAVKSFGEEDNRPLVEKEKKKEEAKEDLKSLPAVEEDSSKKKEEIDRLKQSDVLSEQEVQIHSMTKEKSLPEEEIKQDAQKHADSVELIEILESIEQSEKTAVIDALEPGEMTIDPDQESIRGSPDRKLGLSKASSKSVHLHIGSDKDGSNVFEPEKDPNVSEVPKAPPIDPLPVVGTNDSLELASKSLHAPIKKPLACICEDKNYWEELEKLKEENKMLRDGSEIQRLKEEVEEKMRRILELNEENRALNDMINILRKKQANKKQKDPLSDSEPISSDSDYYTEVRQPPQGPSKAHPTKKRLLNRENQCEVSKKVCFCQKDQEKEDESLPFIDVYKREDKGKFISDSSSTVCNEEVCPCSKTSPPFGSPDRARGGNDSNNPCPAGTFPNYKYADVMEECQDEICPVKNPVTPFPQPIDSNAVYCGVNEIPLLCGNKSCQTEGCEEFPAIVQPPMLRCNVNSCLNTVCMEDERIVGMEDLGLECCDQTCPNKDYYPPSGQVPDAMPISCVQSVAQSQHKGDGSAFITCSPLDCVDDTCVIVECPSKMGYAQVPQMGTFPITCENNTCQVIDCSAKTGDVMSIEPSYVSQGFKDSSQVQPPGLPTTEVRPPMTEECQKDVQTVGMPIDQQTSSFARPPLQNLDGRCPRVVCDTCACIAVPPTGGQVHLGVAAPAQTISGGERKCPRGFCEACACVMFPGAVTYDGSPKSVSVPIGASIHTTQSEAKGSPGAGDEEICAICGCKLTKSDIIRGQICPVPPSVVIQTDQAGKGEQCVCDKPETALGIPTICDQVAASQFKEPTGTMDQVPLKQEPFVQADKTLVSEKPSEVKGIASMSDNLCPDDICGTPCTCHVVPSEEYMDSDTDLKKRPIEAKKEGMSEKASAVVPSEVCSVVCSAAIENPSLQVTEKASAACSAVCSKASSVVPEKPSDIGSMARPVAVDTPSIQVGETTSMAVADKASSVIPEKPEVVPVAVEEPSIHAQAPSEVCSVVCSAAIENPSLQVTEKASAACSAVCSKASSVLPEKPSEVCSVVNPSLQVGEKASVACSAVGSEAVSVKAPSTMPEIPSVTTEKPSHQISVAGSAVGSVAVNDKPSVQTAGQPKVEITDGVCGDTSCDRRYAKDGSAKTTSPEARPPSAGVSQSAGDDRSIIRCICKSKYCKVVPDPDNPNQKLCIDVSATNVRRDSCICAPLCPEKVACDESPTPQYQNQTTVMTVNQLYKMPSKTPEDLSKQQEYAGLSRKDGSSRRIGYIAPRKASSRYGILDDDEEELPEKYETKNADLKLVIADLKSKLLDAEDKIEDLKAGKQYSDKDNDTALIYKYSQEIKEMKKSMKWSKKEREEYEYLKQRVKLLEQGKGDTENITSNLQTAEERIVIRNQLKKLTKKNKCYEEVVQFFKDEMSVMSDELLTLQEVLNVSNVSSQEENNKLIGAILQLRRINDRLVGHLCAIEKQAILESQINQINEARINELQNIISAKNNDLNQHDDIIQDLRRKLNNATKQNADLKNTIKNLTDTVVEIQEGIKSVEREQIKNSNDPSIVESKVCLATGDLGAIKTCMEQKNNRILDLENQLKCQEVDLILATKELGMLKEKKAESKEMMNSLKEQLSIAEKKNEQIIGDYQVVVKKLQDHSNLEHMKNYELNHYKSLAEEMKMSLVQLNNGLEKCEASNIHFYEDLRNSDKQRGHFQNRKNNLPIVFEELKKSMADMKKKLSDADFKGGLIEEELLKVKESHMSQVAEDVSDSQRELETKILSSIEEQSRLKHLVEEQSEEIENLRKELEMERADTCCCKRSVSELKNEKTTANAEMEISQLKCELNKSLHRQRLLNEENDQIHTQMINLRKKLTILEQAYDVLRQENEEYKLQLKKTAREKEYLAHRNQEMTKTIEQMRSTHDQLQKQCRTMMKQMSDEKSWIKTPMQQPFSSRRYGAVVQTERRAASPIRTRKLDRHTADSRYRSSNPWRDLNTNMNDEYLPEDTNSHKSNIMRNISYDSNSSPYTSRSPSPVSNSVQGEDDDLDDLNDWFSPNYKETDTDADDGEDAFIHKVHLMTVQVQEANKRWQKKMNKDQLSRGSKK